MENNQPPQSVKEKIQDNRDLLNKKIAIGVGIALGAVGIGGSLMEKDSNNSASPEQFKKPAIVDKSQIQYGMPLTDEERQKMKAELSAYDAMPKDQKFSSENFKAAEKIRRNLYVDGVTRSMNEIRKNPTGSTIISNTAKK